MPGHPAERGPEYSPAPEADPAPRYSGRAPFVPDRARAAASGTVAAAMAILADLERLLERVFERSSARLFRTHVQAVQLERRVERAMEHARLADGGRTTVPSRYRVRLAPPDLAAAAQQEGSAEALAGRLADAALAFARAHGYHLRGRPTVSLLADPSVVPGEIGVDAVMDGAPTPVAVAAAQAADTGPAAHASPAAHPAPDARAASVSAAALGATGATPAPARPPSMAMPTPATPATPAQAAHATPPVAAPPPPAEPPSLSEDDRPGIRGDGTHTLVFRRPAPRAARATLRACSPDGSERTIEVDGAQLTIGRAQDNGLVLADSRVSRHHARLASRHGALVYTDLGSTNGSRVNGVRVDEIVLGSGDRIQLGDTVLVVETLPG